MQHQISMQNTSQLQLHPSQRSPLSGAGSPQVLMAATPATSLHSVVTGPQAILSPTTFLEPSQYLTVQPVLTSPAAFIPGSAAAVLSPIAVSQGIERDERIGK